MGTEGHGEAVLAAREETVDPGSVRDMSLFVLHEI